MKRLTALTAITIILTMVFLTACTEEGGGVGFNEPKRFSSLREIPGITQEDIDAVAELRARHDRFIYGMPRSTELYEDANGELSGFAVLYCEWLSELFGIRFEPQLHEWLELQDSLRTHDICFTGELTRTPAREADGYLMTKAIASRPVKVFRLAGAEPLSSFNADNPLKTGFARGTATIRSVTGEMAPGTYTVVELDDVDDAYEALRSGQIDAFYYSGVMEIRFVGYDDVVITDFYPLIFMPVSMTTRNPELKPIIDIIDKVLEGGGLHYITTQYNHALREYRRYTLYMKLSPEERLFIRDNPTILMGVDPNNYPGSFYDDREKRWSGIFLDILDEISDLTGLSFKRVNDRHVDFPELYDMLLRGEISLVPEISYTAERSGLFLWSGTTLMPDNFALISHADFPKIEQNEVLYARVGFARDTVFAEMFDKWFPDHVNKRVFESTNEAFEALKNGHIDMVMASEMRLLYLTHYLEMPYYKVNVSFDYPMNAKIGLSKDSEILQSIINKALGLIDHRGINDNWILRTYDYRSRLAEAQREAQRPLWIGLFALMLCVLCLIAILLFVSLRSASRLKRLVEKRTHELALHTAMLTTLFDSIPDFVFVKDMDLRYIQINRSMLKHFNREKDDVIGQFDSYAGGLNISEEDARRLNERDLLAIRERRTIAAEELIPHADGTKMLFEVIKAPLLIDGEPMGVLGIARDITIRKEMEEAALSASRSKSEFLANMSHEIRTPMNSIIGFSELALDSDISPKTRDYLSKIHENSEWLLQLINDILDISKIEAGKMELDNTPIDLHELFVRCRTM